MGDSGRVLALDVGSVRVGVAISDVNRIIASGIGVWNAENLLDEFRKCVEKYDPKIIVLGLPVRTDNKDPEKSEACDRVSEVISELKSEFPELRYETWDERFTTVIAQRVLIEADVSRKKRKKNVDKLAAVLILESWLERYKFNG